MGVGTYRQDYQGTGRSINVDGPLPSDEDYAAYCKDMASQGDEPMDREEWGRDVYDQANEDMLHVVDAVARDVGLHSMRKGRYDGGKVDFDRELTGIATGSVFEIGWRSWQHDYVIGIGPVSDFEEFVSNPDENAIWSITERGRPADALKEEYDGVLEEFETLVRLSLMQGGLDTSVPTSGYTSRPDTAPADISERIEALTASVKAGIERLNRPFKAIVGLGTGEERVALARAILGYAGPDSGYLPKVLVATSVENGAGVNLWDPSDEDNGLMSSATVPKEMAPYLSTLPSIDELAPVPFNAETSTWYASVQRDRVVLSPEQYAQASGEACIVAWKDDETNEAGTVTLHEGPEPAAAPGV